MEGLGVGSWVLGAGRLFLGLGSWGLVVFGLGSWFLVFGPWFLVLGCGGFRVKGFGKISKKVPNVRGDSNFFGTASLFFFCFRNLLEIEKIL